MGCLGCSTCSSSGSAKGCQSNGGCGSGGCNRLNTFDWLSHLEISDIEPCDIVEVSFKNGAHKAFFQVEESVRVGTGDIVVVETGNGYDIGKVTLSGELVRLQMKKKKAKPQAASNQVIRRANERDLERLQEAREMEGPTMVRARAIARSLGLDMKIGDVEFQGDRRKATFYYTADGRVDFRELIRHFAKEFKIKIEMRQIGARQESARIGGIGSCGRELCCSTWLSDFKSVSTAAARYQNLAINQAKLSGQCGRLKCCLNYELDTYLDALESFPEKSDYLYTQKGKGILVKTDIFKRIMFYVYEHERGKGQFYPIEVEKVREIIEMNARGEKPAEFEISTAVSGYIGEATEVGFADVTGEIELPDEKKRRKKKKKPRERESMPNNRDQGQNRPPQTPTNRQEGQQDRRDRQVPRQEGQQDRRDRQVPRQEGQQDRRDRPAPKPPGEENREPQKPNPSDNAEDRSQQDRRNWKKKKNKRR